MKVIKSYALKRYSARSYCIVSMDALQREIVGLPSWHLASRPGLMVMPPTRDTIPGIQTKSCFPRRGQILTPRLPGIEPGPLDLKSGSPAGLSRFELGLPWGGLGPHRPRYWRYPINPRYSADPLQAISSL